MSNHAETPATKPRRWLWIVGLVVAFLFGIGIGAAGGDETEPAADETLEPQPTATVTVDPSGDRVAELDEREAALDEREGELDEYAAELDSIAADLESEIEAVAANTVGDGVWVVGVDIEPGTYRAADVSSDCYWGITATGSNGSDIIDNGIPGGGNPQVTLAEGQDFESQRCGEWVKQ